MRFNYYGDKNKPCIIMLAGSFCPGECMEYIYSKLCDDFYIIVPTYNGHYENSGDFTARQNEAAEVKQCLIEKNISDVKMIYGQSMGAEIGMELISQLGSAGIGFDCAFFDGGPFITLSKAYKTFMYFKFRSLINIVRKKSVDELLKWKFLNQFTNGDTASLRSMIESVAAIAPYLSDKSLKNEVECCYTFDFPTMDNNTQNKLFFFYAREEKAFTTCFRFVKKAYPNAHFKVIKGYGHLTYSVRNTDKYVGWLKRICAKKSTF